MRKSRSGTSIPWMRKLVLEEIDHLLSDYNKKTTTEKKNIDKRLLYLGNSLLQITRLSREARKGGRVSG